MNLTMKIFATMALVLLAGCAAIEKTEQNREQIKQELTRAEPVSVVAVPDEELRKQIGELRTESQQSNNNTNNRIEGIGLQFSKVAEKVQGFGGDLAHVKTTFETSFKAQAEVIANLKVQLDVANTAIANFHVDLKNSAELNTALKQQLETLTQNVSAGRDSNVKTIQFNSNMVEALKNDGRTQFWTVVVFALLTFLLQERSRARAEARFHNKVFERRLHDETK